MTSQSTNGSHTSALAQRGPAGWSSAGQVQAGLAWMVPTGLVLAVGLGVLQVPHLVPHWIPPARGVDRYTLCHRSRTTISATSLEFVEGFGVGRHTNRSQLEVGLSWDTL